MTRLLALLALPVTLPCAAVAVPLAACLGARWHTTDDDPEL